MALFPKIQSPCPLKSNLSAHMDGDQCRHCNQRVHDLSSMTDQERNVFLANCGEEVCVSYRLPAALALGGALIASSLVSPPAHAEEQALGVDLKAGSNWLAQQAAENIVECDTVQMVIVGGIKKMSEADYIDSDIDFDSEADLAMQAIAVVYEDET